MKRVREADAFAVDYAKRFDWYFSEGGDAADLAIRFQEAVKSTLRRIGREPTIGRIRKFRHPRLSGLRSILVAKPFEKILIFYRITDDAIEIWRMMHGSRNLPRRLLESNE